MNYPNHMEKWISFIILSITFCGCVHKNIKSSGGDIEEIPIISQSADGTSITSWLYPQFAANNKGLMVYLHGGPHISVRNEMPAVISFFRKIGFSVLGIDYRGSRGYGVNFQNTIQGNLGDREIEDVYSSLKSFLALNPIYSDKPIFLSGHSYGGFLALLISIDSKNPFQKIVAMAAPSDLRKVYASLEKCSLPACIGARREMREDIYGSESDATYLSRRNPLAMTSKIGVPVYVVQGELDPFVPMSLTKKFIAASKKNKRSVELLILSGVGHDLGAMNSPEDFMKNLAPVSTFLEN